jgi:hypothetical protein
VTADLDTRAVELYAPMGEVLPFRRRGGDGAVEDDRDAGRSLSEPAVVDGFASSRARFESLVRFLDGTDAAGLDHAGLEDRLDRDGRELLRGLLDDHLALRAVREQRLESVVDDDEVTRGRVEREHRRVLGTVFGKVTVSRMAYRAPGRGNLHPADAALNLPVERTPTGCGSWRRWKQRAGASRTPSMGSSGRAGSSSGNARSRSSLRSRRSTSRTPTRSADQPGLRLGICW